MNDLETVLYLQDQVDKLKALNGELCAAMIEKTDTARGLYADLKAAAPDLARVWARSKPWLEVG